MTLLCRGCDEPLTKDTKDNDSDAHVIPRALGGRLAPRGILCAKCNGLLNEVADLPLINAFGAWPTILDVSRQGGKQPSRTVETRGGHKVSVDTNGKAMRQDVVYVAKPVTVDGEPGHAVELGAGKMKIARQLLQKAKKQFPHLDVAIAEQHLKTVALPPGDEFRLPLDMRPEAVFGGVLAAVWLYLIHTTREEFTPFNELLKLIAKMKQNPGTFRYFTEGLPGLKGPKIDLGHKVIVRTVPATCELIFYVEVLGVLKVGGLLAQVGPDSEPFEHVYAYDLAQKVDRSEEFSIDGSVFDAQEWRKAGFGVEDGKLLFAHFEKKMMALADIYYRERIAAATAAEAPLVPEGDNTPTPTNSTPAS